MGARLTLFVLLLSACSGPGTRPAGNPARIGLKLSDATMTDSGDRIEIMMRLQLVGVPKRVTRIRLDINGESLAVQPDVQAVDVHFDVTPPPPSAVNVVAFVMDSEYGEQRQDFRFSLPWAHRNASR